jgi:hypothetical protein
MKSLRFALVVAFSFALMHATPVLAQSASAGADGSEEETAMWVQRLDDAKARLDTSKQQLLSYLAQKSEGAARRYPVGPAKAAYLEGIKESSAEYEAARAALPDEIDEARRGGVVPGVLDSYEQAAERAVPLAEITDNAAAQANPGDDDVTQAAIGDDGVDGGVHEAVNTDTPESPAKNTDTDEYRPGPGFGDDRW